MIEYSVKIIILVTKIIIIIIEERVGVVMLCWWVWFEAVRGFFSAYHSCSSFGSPPDSAVVDELILL